jgi:hypothetical protein
VFRQTPDRRQRQSAAKAAGYAADPTLAMRIAAANRRTKAPLVAARLARETITCAVHGELQKAECYEHRRQGRPTNWECRACAAGRESPPPRPDSPECKAAIKAGRRAGAIARAAERTHFDCKVHGQVLLSECFGRKAKNGLVKYCCKVCNLAKQKADRAKRARTGVAEMLRPHSLYGCPPDCNDPECQADEAVDRFKARRAHARDEERSLAKYDRG